jgi:hypothetical protein
MSVKSVGTAIDRVDGRLKVTGAAKYATDFTAKNTAHAVLVGSAIAKGKIKKIDADAALQAPGVLAVITHQNVSKKVSKLTTIREDFFKGGKPGEDRLPLADDVIYYAGQYVAVVVADSVERALYAAALVKVTYCSSATNRAARRPNQPSRSAKNYSTGAATRARLLPIPRPSKSSRPTRRLLRRTTRWSRPVRLPFGRTTASRFTTRRSGSKGRRRPLPTHSACLAPRSMSSAHSWAAVSAAKALLGLIRS